ncbi:DUF3179 domain-containing protein [Oricola cellulosilytica]|uniref:DUF3179 domain-containing protein n=1 Tax=Oricola cellulosilytica TaxID=1429082 RepID=A0A4R0PD72_9HYPH|nr:DUF3179 domain-containing protein [Oricola cellulosilytica]TCD14269.1 DUF3179 domain-containing protein [Oricola cellulosilytica]
MKSLLALATALALAATQIANSEPLRWKSEGWRTDFTKSTVDLDRVLSGGPPRDGIPSIDDPKFIPIGEETSLDENEAVIGLKINGDARAYPIRIVTWHEIVNDTVGGVPVAVTYCPLCNSSLTFDRRVEGEVLEFGTTGKLKDSNLIMYDRTTDSWWQQFSGDAIAGSYAGTFLKLLPSRLQSWSEFKAENPDGKVLVPNNPRLRDYGRNPYAGYDTARPFLYDGQLPPDIEPMERVVVVRRDGEEPLIVTLNKVREDNGLREGDYQVEWAPGQRSALDTSQIAKGREVGTITVQKGGRDVPYDVTFAFVAHAFYPDVAIRKD